MTLLEIGTSELREGSIPVLETERLILRAPRLGDAKVLAALANDKRIAENTRRIPHPYKRSDADDFISAVNVPGPDGEVAFLITLRDGPVIGACGIAMQDGAPDVGYWLGVKYWNKGYATEATRAVIDFAFTEFGHNSLSAGARVTNPASRRIWKSAASSGPASASAASARSTRRRRSTASASIAGCGSRSKAGRGETGGVIVSVSLLRSPSP